MSSSNQRAQQKNFINLLRPQQIVTPPPAYQANTMAHLIPNVQMHNNPDSDDEEDGDRPSGIRIRIHTPLHITGDNNVISTDVGVNAGKVSLAVVTALKQICIEGAGVPMIDGDGAPRPLDVKVTAEIKIDGSHNIVGEKAILGKVAPGVEAKKLDVVEQNGQGIKRERVGSEPVETDPKRVRVD